MLKKLWQQMVEFTFKDLQSNAEGGSRFAPYFFNGVPAKTAEGEKYQNLEQHVAKKGKTSLLGTPIFMPCALEFQDKNDSVKLDLYGEPLIQVTMNKTIIKTPIDGKKGTFKELYSMNDYAVIIRGYIMNDDGNDYPEAEVRKLRTMLERPKHLRVVNELCRIFGISYIAVESADFPAVEGAQNYQPFQINALSDALFDIKLKQKKA